ncbi:MAG: carboxypeptidase-like regulatory domain-containing protein [Aeromicrobium erythreum]
MRRLLLHVLCLVAFAAATLVASPGPPAAAEAVTFRGVGTVIDEDFQKPVGGLRVEVHQDFPDGQVRPVTTDATDGSGRFAADLPGPGDYWVSVVDPSGTFEAQTVSHHFDVDAPAVSIRLRHVQGKVTGFVRDQHGQAIDYGVAAFSTTDPTTPVRPISKDRYSDRFALSLPPGSYKLRLEGPFEGPDQRWVGGADFDSARVLEVTSKGLDVGLVVTPRAGYVTGRVVDEQGRPLKGVLARPAVLSSGRWVLLGGALTRADGTYVAGPYAAFDQVRMSFEDRAGGHVAEWFDDSPDLEGARDLSTREGIVNDQVDATLAAGPDVAQGNVSGRLRDATGAPADDVWVVAHRADTGSTVQTTISRRDGRYVFGSLPAGTYVISFKEVERLGPQRFVPAVLGGGSSLATGRRVVVPESGQVDVPDQVLRRYGTIAGSVVAPASVRRLPGFQRLDVSVVDEDGRTVPDHSSGGIEQDFDVSELEPGRYRVTAYAVLVDDVGRERHVAARWNGGSFTRDAAPWITVRDGATARTSFTLTDALTSVTRPTVRGTARKGSTLVASPGTWGPTTTTTYRYQWYRGASAIKGATSARYRVVSADVRSRLRVRVVASDARETYRPGSAISAWTSTVRTK